MMAHKSAAASVLTEAKGKLVVRMFAGAGHQSVMTHDVDHKVVFTSKKPVVNKGNLLNHMILMMGNPTHWCSTSMVR